MTEFTFFFIALSVCITAFLAVLSRNIFRCAVWLALTLLGIAGIYFYLDAEFLGVVQVLVYVGGIITLFIFAIKLTAKIGDKTIRHLNDHAAVSGIISLIFLYLLFKIISSHPWAGGQGKDTTLSLKEVGKSLITIYALPLEFISLILLAAMVGAIVIGKAKK